MLRIFWIFWSIGRILVVIHCNKLLDLISFLHEFVCVLMHRRVIIFFKLFRVLLELFFWCRSRPRTERHSDSISWIWKSFISHLNVSVPLLPFNFTERHMLIRCFPHGFTLEISALRCIMWHVRNEFGTYFRFCLTT